MVEIIPQLEFVFPVRFDKSELEDGLPFHQDSQWHQQCQH